MARKLPDPAVGNIPDKVVEKLPDFLQESFEPEVMHVAMQREGDFSFIFDFTTGTEVFSTAEGADVSVVGFAGFEDSLSVNRISPLGSFYDNVDFDDFVYDPQEPLSQFGGRIADPGDTFVFADGEGVYVMGNIEWTNGVFQFDYMIVA
jgi:hypothetical protein